MTRAAPRGFMGWRMVLLAALAQNCAMGLAFGSFGPLLASTEQHFGLSRAMAASGMSALLVAIGLLSPLAGQALQRVRLRSMLLTGAVLSAGGYAGLAQTASFTVALAMYALIGAGASMLGVVAPVTLITRWFEQARGRALSLVYLPILLLATPFAVAAWLPALGRTSMLLGIAALFVALLLPLLWVVERPEDVGQRAWGAKAQDGAPAGEGGAPVAARAIVTDLRFWIVSLGVGAIAGSASAYVVHIIAYGVEQQMSLPQAALLLSVYSGCGIVGSLLFGWLADRAGAVAALAVSALGQALLWWAVLQAEGSSLWLASALMGACAVPINTLHGAAMGALFGGGAVARALGYSYLLKLPFLFTFAPLVGLLFERSGQYRLPFLAMSGVLAGATVLFLLLLVRPGDRAARHAA